MTSLLEARPQPRIGRPPRILFAEDDIDIGDFVTEMLRAEGLDVTTVGSGDDGAITFDNHPFHLLLTDVRMPGTKDGLELAAYVRRKDPSLPIVIVSGYADGLGTRLAALGRKVTFIRKPFRIGDLISAIENALLSTAASIVISSFCKFSELFSFNV